MVDGKLEHDWTLLSEVLAIIYNVNRAAHAAPLTGDQLNPYVKAKRRPVMGQITDLKIFAGGGNSCQEHPQRRSRLDAL
jgi:hypothetical protein